MPIRIDERLTKIASFVDRKKVADIGCDHGKLGYYLVGTDKVDLVIATDISAPSLKKTSELALENGVEHRLLTRLGDGLIPICSGEVEQIVIAGLGGDLMSRILIDSHCEGKTFDSFILSCNTHPESVRQAILDIGHKILEDDIVFCMKKPYVVIKTQIGSDNLSTEQLKFGKYFDINPNFKVYAREQIEKMNHIITINSGASRLQDDIDEWKKALGGEYDK